jgi:hypothetical protein
MNWVTGMGLRLDKIQYIPSGFCLWRDSSDPDHKHTEILGNFVKTYDAVFVCICMNLQVMFGMNRVPELWCIAICFYGFLSVLDFKCPGHTPEILMSWWLSRQNITLDSQGIASDSQFCWCCMTQAQCQLAYYTVLIYVYLFLKTKHVSCI